MEGSTPNLHPPQCVERKVDLDCDWQESVLFVTMENGDFLIWKLLLVAQILVNDGEVESKSGN